MEAVNKFVNKLLLLTWSLQELNEVRLAVVETQNDLVALSFYIRHDYDAVFDICAGHFFPNFDFELSSVGDSFASLACGVHIVLRNL